MAIPDLITREPMHIVLNMLLKAVILYTLSVAVAASPVLQERDDVTWYRPDPAVYVCKNLDAWDECAKAYSYCSIALNYPQEAW
ncbi:unnamed protein product [Clonostachys rosea]|uniref:Uncharacterized protein n=1 Tax=Bionectria ochroleuca TaxID=29856 RepID=A0ABY6UJL7_BIOOC|nr:unnamed protein product [Clonostachys rosea]